MCYSSLNDENKEKWALCLLDNLKKYYYENPFEPISTLVQITNTNFEKIELKVIHKEPKILKKKERKEEEIIDPEFNFFAKNEKKRLKEEYPFMKSQDIIKTISHNWFQLKESEKKQLKINQFFNRKE